MKRLMLTLFLLPLLAGCDQYIPTASIEPVYKMCDKNDGLHAIEVSVRVIHIYCKDGAKFTHRKIYE